MVIMTFDLIVTALVRELKCCNYTFISSLLIIFNWLIKPCHGKGGAVGAAAAAGGATAGVDWTAGGNYTEEEMVVALIVVGIIMSVSLLICACQCYQKVLWEIENTHIIVNKVTKRPMPPAPYNRDAMA